MKNKVIFLSGTHNTGKTFLSNEISKMFKFNVINNVFRSIMDSVKQDCISYRSSYLQMLALEKFREIHLDILNRQQQNFVTDRFISDVISYCILYEINDYDYEAVIMEIIYNINKSDKDVFIYSTIFGDKLYEIFNNNLDFFINNLSKDEHRRKTVFNGIDESINIITKFEKIYLNILDVFIRSNLNIKIFNLSDNYRGENIIYLFNNRNNFIIEDIKRRIIDE